MADRKIVQALSPFNGVNADGVPVPVRRGDLYYDDDPMVVGSPGLFGAPEVQDSTAFVRRGPRPLTFGATETAVSPPTGPARAPVTNAGKAAAAGKAGKAPSAPAGRPVGEV